MKEQFGLVEQVEVVIRDKYGKIKKKHVLKPSIWHRILVKLGLRHNSIVATGMAQIAKLILTDTTDNVTFDYLGIGSNNTAPTVNDTDLLSPIKRKAGTGTLETTTYTNDTAKLVATFSSGDGLNGTSTICEVGMFTAETGGIMLFRQVYSPADTLNWDDGDTYELTLKVQIKQGT